MSIYGTVSVKLFIDKEKKKVLFAESDKDFVDILFSFLTLPLGTIVRRLGRQSQIGCLDEVYKSVESLNEDHFQTKACKTMLLSPVNAAAFHCDRLKVQIDDDNSRRFYFCNANCRTMTPVKGNCCNCGNGASYWECPQNVFVTVEGNDDGVFVKSGTKFIVTDDLQVTPASTTLVFSLLDRFGLQEQAKIDEKIFQLNASKIISLLQRASLSKQSLTGLYFDVAVTPDDVNIHHLPEILLPKEADGTFTAIMIKLVHTKDDSSVLYAEVGEDFVDLIFGLLSVPLGCVINTYGQMSPNGCLGSLYSSIDGRCVKSECKYLLRNPKLAPFFGCSRNLLQTEELYRRSLTFNCLKCRTTTGQLCRCITPSTKPLRATVEEMNPKYVSKGSFYDNGKSYIKGGPRNFLVTDDLRIIDFSLTNTLQVLRASKIPKEKLVEKQLALDRTQVLKLVRAALVTGGALSSVLLPPK